MRSVTRSRSTRSTEPRRTLSSRSIAWPALRQAGGYTLVELLITLVLAAFIAAFAVPRLDLWIGGIRMRAALNIVTSQIYLARMHAVRSGYPAQLVLANENGCVQNVRIQLDPAGGGGSSTMALTPGFRCIRYSGDSVLSFNGRGMLKPPTRSVYAADPRFGDTLRISIAGRVRRTY